MAGPGQTVDFNCPIVNQPYVYHPTGLRSATTTLLIRVNQPTPAHDGKRFCIIEDTAAPTVTVNVFAIPESEFQTYR